MALFNNLSIMKKMTAVFLLFSILWCAICGVAVGFMLIIKQDYTQLLHGQATALLKAKEIQYHVATQNHAIVAYLVTTGAGGVTDQRSLQLLDRSNGEIIRLAEEMSPIVGTSEEREMLAAIIQTNKQYKQKADEIVQAVESEGNHKRAEVIMQTEVVNLSAVMMGKVNQVAAKQQAQMEQEEANNDKRVQQIVWMIAASAAVAMILALFISYIVAKRMTKPLVRMVAQSEQLAAGNLRIEADEHQSGDEIGQLSLHFREMASNLRQLVERIAHSSADLNGSVESWQQNAAYTAAASQHIAEIMQSAQQSVIEQMNNIALTNQSTQQMSEKIMSITQKTKQVTDHAMRMQDMSQQGSMEMKETGRQMSKIHDSVRDLQGEILTFGTKTGSIGKIVDMIASIAKQTNMLALNASIEAAKAGGYGRGFSVIAEDIRKLSLQTAESAREINQFVSEIIREADRSADSVGKSMQEVEEGIAAVARAEDTFTAIMRTIAGFSQEMRDISQIATQIEQLTGQVVEAIEQVTQMSQATSQQTEEVSAATQEQLASMEEILQSAKGMSELAKALQQAIHHFSW